ncbi:MAG: DnaJ domain-containing protein [Pseudomonadota bacterium]
MKIPSEDSILEMNRPDLLESLGLEPEEAFVLSRIDGSTTLKGISQILGYDVARVWKLLSRGVEAGAIRIKEVAAPQPARVAKHPLEKSILSRMDEEDRDPVLSQIPRVKRNEILLRYNAMASQNHYGLLGVKRNALLEEIRTHYFHLMKTLHPDRFFGKDLGHYREKLDGLFKRITVAYDELQDPGKRKRYDHTLGDAVPGEAAAKSAAAPRDPRLKGKTLVERLALAKKYFDMGRHEEAAGDGLKAANFYQMALQFEPDSRTFQEALERNAAFILRKRADEGVKRAQELIELMNYEEAIEALEEVVKINPKKKECYRELALIYWKYKKTLPEARKLTEQAVRMFANDAASHALYGRICLEMGEDSKAKAAFKEALRLDRENAEAQEGLEELKRK